MNNEEGLKRKLLTGYLLFGILNLLIVSSVFYMQTRRTLLKRGFDHMTSVRTLVEQKLNLYFQSIKEEAKDSPEDLKQNPAVLALAKFRAGKWTELKGTVSLDPDLYPLDALTPLEGQGFVLKSLSGKESYFWIFDHSAINDILYSREGLGKSGETYLVGQDHRIKSASRFEGDWKSIYLNNESVSNALKAQSGTAIVKDYRGIKVLSAYSQVAADGLNFGLLTEIDFDEVLGPLNEIFTGALALGLILSVINLLVAKKVSGKIVALIKEMRLKLDEVSHSLIKAQESERSRFAYYLHDSIGQYMTGLKFGLSNLAMRMKGTAEGDTIRDLETLSESMIQEVRAISHDLMPSLIKDFGCCKAINEYLLVQKKIFPIAIGFHFDDAFKNLKGNSSFSVNLYRMVQELIQNAVKHSKAKSISIDCTLKNSELVVRYSDDGVGMSQDNALPRTLLYRTELYDGTMMRIPSETGLILQFTFTLKDVTYEKDKPLLA